MDIIPVLAAISGNALIAAFIWVVVAGVIFWLCNWFLAYAGVPEPFSKVAKVVLALVVLIVLINALLTLAGRPLITWGP